jgi:hypothetical protein
LAKDMPPSTTTAAIQSNVAVGSKRPLPRSRYQRMTAP